MCTLFISFSRSSNSINRNRILMIHDATHLTESQQCEIITKLSKLNALSKRVLGWEYEANEGANWKIWDNRENTLQQIICCESLLRHLLNLKLLPTSKALKLYTSLSSTSRTNCFAPMFKRKLDRCTMNCDDHLRCFSETLTN